MALFGSDKKEQQPAQQQQQQPAAGQAVPVSQVLAMRSQGLSNNQIIQNLQREGFKSHQIFDAMNQADLRASAHPATAQRPMPGQGMPPGRVEPLMSPYYEQQAQPWPGAGEQPQSDAGEDLFGQPGQEGAEETFNMPSADSVPMIDPLAQPQPMARYPSAGPSMPSPGQGDSVDRIEEVAEAIIDEKWSELMKHIQKIVDWKQRVDSRIIEMENRFKSLEEEFNKLHESVIGKVQEYDQNIRDVGTEIKGMEKVFQKIIPELTTNVSELSKLTDSLKDEEHKRRSRK